MTDAQTAARRAAAKKYYYANRERLQTERTLAWHANSEFHRARARRYWVKHRTQRRLDAKRRREANPEKVKAQKRVSDQRNIAHVRAYQRKWNQQHIVEQRVYKAQYRWRIRLEAIAAYGGVCRCCGESAPQFLTIDHIDNDGAAERKGDRTRTGTKFYLDLRRRGWPRDKYQLLCFNCNCAKGIFGACPHELALDQAVEAMVV